MITRSLDSRTSLGSDLATRRSPAQYPYVETSGCRYDFFAAKPVRVVVGRLANVYRFSAPGLDVVADGGSIDDAWNAFLAAIVQREDAAWLTFDVGPTRAEEIEEGLNAPEDEDWAEPDPESGAG